MERELEFTGLFNDSGELRDAVRRRKMCYDVEPYVIPDDGQLIQIGFQLTLHGTFPADAKNPGPDSPEYHAVERDVIRIAQALSRTCGSAHMCESTIPEPGTLTYSADRKMRPDITVRIPVFDQQNFGHPVDDAVKEALHGATQLLEHAGVRKKRWEE